MGIFKKLASNLKKLLKNKKKSKPTAKSKKKPAKSKAKKSVKSKAKKSVKAKSKSKKKASKKKLMVKKSPSLPKNYVKLGVVTHYFPHVEAGVVKITKGAIEVGDAIHIKGATTDFKQRVESIQIDHKPVQKAKKGSEIGLETEDKVRQHDVVYLVKP